MWQSDNARRVEAFLRCCLKRRGHPMHLLRQEPVIARALLSLLGVLSTDFTGGSWRSSRPRFCSEKGVRDVCFRPRTGRLIAITPEQMLTFDTFRPGWPRVSSAPSPFHTRRSLSGLAAHDAHPVVAVSDLFGSFALLGARPPHRTLQKVRLDRRYHDGSIGSLHFHPTKNLLAVGTKQRVLLFRSASGGPAGPYEMLERPSCACAGYVHTVRLHPTAPLCFFADHQGGVYVADLRTGVVRVLPFYCTSLCARAAVGDDFGLVAVSCYAGVQVCEMFGVRLGGAGLRVRRSAALEGAISSSSSGAVAVHATQPLLAHVCKVRAEVRVLHTRTGVRVAEISIGSDVSSGLGFGADVLLRFHPRRPVLVVLRGRRQVGVHDLLPLL